MTPYESLHAIPIDMLAEKIGGRHRLARLVSLRLRAINGGAPLLVVKQEGEAALAAVCREILEEKIWLDVPDEHVTEPASDADYSDLGEVADEAGTEA